MNPESLKLVMLTAGEARPHRIVAAVEAASDAGITAVLVREPRLDARRLGELCDRLRPGLHARGILLLVHDRIDVVAANYADGVHLGHRSLPVAAARRVLGPEVPIGYSAHDADEIARCAAEAASYAFLSPVFPTPSHPGSDAMGPEEARRLTDEADLPIVWLGGMAAEHLRGVSLGRASGVAALSAFAEPARAAREARALRDLIDRGV